MKRYEIKYLLKEDVSALVGTEICVKGWGASPATWN